MYDEHIFLQCDSDRLQRPPAQVHFEYGGVNRDMPVRVSASFTLIDKIVPCTTIPASAVSRSKPES